ncbi:PKD domain-containing protein [Methanoregula sp.]|uniref:PKD domain-containing protein n=1 Tax=Methanoregula sp. TaxID=2052170 RepID=UPI003425779F
MINKNSNDGFAHIWISILFFLVLLCTVVTVITSAGTVTLITTNTTESNQWNPAIYDNWIVWTDNRDNTAFTSYQDIYAYNITTGEEKRITNPGSYADHPSISGTLVAFDNSRSGNTDIYLVDLESGSRWRITENDALQEFPSISGNRIVWQDKRQGSYDIYLNGTSPGLETILTPDTATTNQNFPIISGEKVVWQDERNSNSIYMINMSSGSSYLISPDGVTFDFTGFPEITFDNGIVAWRDPFKKIVTNDTRQLPMSQSEVSLDSTTQKYPSISGNKIIWIDDRESLDDIYFNEIPGSSDERITTFDDAVELLHGSPKIFNNRIVWTDNRNSGFEDIYLYTLDHDEPCPVADFTMSSQSGAIPHTIQFNDTSTDAENITHWNYEFGDGNVSEDTLKANQSFTYNVPGKYDVRLTVNNPYCRSETPVDNKYKVSVGASPIAAFTTDVSDGFVDLKVKFTDFSINAETWNWSFGDGEWFNTTDVSKKNPEKTYNIAGTYTPYLYVNNTWGTASAHKTIKALTGANVTANTSVDGFTFTEPYGSQFVTFTKGTAPDCTIAGDSLVCRGADLADNGWTNITFTSNDGIGFMDHGATISGNLSSVSFQITEIHPAGFSQTTGSQSTLNHTITLDTFPENAKVNSQVWEGYTDADLALFSSIGKSSGFSDILGVAYTMKIVKTGIPAGGTAKIHMSVNATWVSNHMGRSHTYIERISDDRSTGEVLRPRFLYYDPATNLDYFEAESSRGSSTFGLVQLTGSGNPFQLITLTIASQVNAPQPSGGSDSYGNSGAPSGSTKGLSAQAPQPAPEQKAPVVFIDPGKTAPLYTNQGGVITQETTLMSTDTLASVVLGEGTVAKDSAGSPLSSLSIASIAPDAIPAAPPSGQAVMIDGRAYELGPDGATFSPGITVTFTIPQAQWGKEYSLMMYDKATGTWSEVPGSFNAKDGTFTAVLSHFCCVALFEKEIGKPVVRQTTVAPQPEPARLAPVATPSPRPPQNALSIVFSMSEWVAGEAANRSSYLTALAIIIIIVLSIMLLHRRRNNP